MDLGAFIEENVRDETVPNNFLTTCLRLNCFSCDISIIESMFISRNTGTNDEINYIIINKINYVVHFMDTSNALEHSD